MRIKLFTRILILLTGLNFISSASAICDSIYRHTDIDKKKYAVIIALNGNECINCYYSMHDIFSAINFDKTLFVLSGIPKREVAYFFEQKLNLQSTDINWVLNDSLYRLYTELFNGESAIYLFNQGEIVYSSGIRSADKIKLLALLQSYTSNKLLEGNVWDISSFGGDGNSTITFLNEDTVLVHNAVRNKIYLYSLSNSNMVHTFDIGVHTDNISEWLSLTELEPNDLDYAKQTREAREYIDALNRIVIGTPHVTDNYVFVPVEILAYDIILQADNDTVVQLKWYSFLAQYNKDLQFIARYPFTYQFQKYPNHFHYLDNANFINDSILYMKPSTRVKDSIVAIYKLLPGNKPALIAFPPVGYPDRFPMKVGPYAKVYYSKFMSATDYYFREEPILYNTVNSNTIELSGWQYTRIGDSTRTGFWLGYIFLKKDKYYVFGIQRKITMLKLYDRNFNLLHSETVMDKPYFSIEHRGNTIYGLVSDEESIKIVSFIMDE